MKYVIASVINFVILYFISVFISWEFNPGVWAYSERVGLISFWFISTAITFIIILIKGKTI